MFQYPYASWLIAGLIGLLLAASAILFVRTRANRLNARVGAPAPSTTVPLPDALGIGQTALPTRAAEPVIDWSEALVAAVGASSLIREAVRARSKGPRAPSREDIIAAVRALETEISHGKLVELIPAQMLLDERAIVQIGFSNSDTQARDRLEERTGRMIETMTVELDHPDGAFTIDPVTPASQLVRHDLFKDTAYQKFAGDFGRWAFIVHPRKVGTHSLSIRISATLLDANDVCVTVQLPARSVPIETRPRLARSSRGPGRYLRCGGALILATFVGAVFGASTHDLWWPAISLTIDWLYNLGRQTFPSWR